MQGNAARPFARELEARLRAWRGEFLRATLLEGFVRFAAGLGGLVLAGAVLDAAVTLPLAARWCLFCLLAASAAGGTLFWFVLPAARGNAPWLLRAAARRYPDLAAYLLPAWELSAAETSSSVAEARTSSALARAHVERTSRLLGQRARLPVFPARVSRGARRGAAGFSACLAVFLPWLHHSSPGLGRILAPWAETPLEEWVEVAPGDLRAVWDSSVVITARIKRRPVENGLGLWIKTERSPWSHADWDSEEAGLYSYRVGDLNQALRYRVQWRDQRGRTYALEPMPFPQLADLKARVHLPGRLKADEAVSETSLEGAGEVSALRGSWIVIHGRPTVALSGAELRVSYLNAPVELKAKPSGEYEGGFPLTEDGSFRLDLASAQGVADPHPVSYGLKATADEIPTIELLSPAFEVEAGPRDSLAISYEAHDDYGLTSVGLLYKRPGRREETLPVARFSKPPADFIGDFSWDLSGMPAGESVEFRLRATDNCALGPQAGYSKTAVVRLMDLEGEHMKVERRWLAVEKDLQALADQEASARGLLSWMQSSASTEEVKALGEQWAHADQDLGRRWPESARSFQEFADAMTKDPYANPGMAETAKSLASELSQASGEDLPRASQAAKEGRLGDAAREHAGLEAQARKAARLMDKGKEIQGLQDLYSDARRMEQAGSELSSALSELAKDGGKASAADRRKLGEALKSLQEQMEALAKTIDSLPKPPSGSPADRRRTFVVPLNEAREEAAALQRALASGDFAEAARIAKELAEELGKARQAIADAARAASEGGDSGGAGGGDQNDELSRKMEAAMAHWQEAIDDQSKSLGLAQKLDEDKTKSLLEAQRKLLEELAARQKAALDHADSLGVFMPADARKFMEDALSEFSAKSVARAPDSLGSAVRRLQAQAAADPARAPALSGLAQEEQGILDDLNKGAAPPPSSGAQAADAGAAADAQEGTRGKTARLEGELHALEDEAVTLPRKALEPVAQAQQEQSDAVSELRGIDSNSALKSEQKALDLLEKGMKEMASAVEQQRRVEAGSMMPFGRRPGGARPGGTRGRTGSDTGFVPLPSADEYQPTQEIRRDLERSLREKRPQSYDRVIKDYFKRISQ